MKNDIYVLNPEYILKNDTKRVLIFNKDTDHDGQDKILEFKIGIEEVKLF